MGGDGGVGEELCLTYKIDAHGINLNRSFSA